MIFPSHNITFLDFRVDSSLASPRGSGLKDLIDQLTIIQWENARVSSERPLALVIVKLNKIAELLASYLARCPELIQRNVKTTFVDGKFFILFNDFLLSV